MLSLSRARGANYRWLAYSTVAIGTFVSVLDQTGLSLAAAVAVLDARAHASRDESGGGVDDGVKGAFTQGLRMAFLVMLGLNLLALTLSSMPGSSAASSANATKVGEQAAAR